MDRETVMTHLQIIHTWAEFARERDLNFFTVKHLEDIAQWADDALNLLKEQEVTINELQNAYGYLQKQFFEAQDKLLKEQAKTKVVFGRTKDGEFVTECGNCGTHLDKAYSNCPKCKKELDWNINQT